MSVWCCEGAGGFAEPQLGRADGRAEPGRVHLRLGAAKLELEELGTVWNSLEHINSEQFLSFCVVRSRCLLSGCVDSKP